MRTVQLLSGDTVPVLGLGTWHMGEAKRARSAEVAALQLGLDLGLSLIDTAEMYGEGGAEEVVGEAITGRRREVFLVSKVYPHNASRTGTIAACERSLKRLRTDVIDLYLLHWRGQYPLAETVQAFEALQKAGKIRHWGVSNFDVDDMDELSGVDGGNACSSNQILYHLDQRGVEWQLLPDCAKASIMVMAYSPLGQGDLLGHPVLSEIGRKHGVTAAAIALAFVIRRPGLIAIPKATQLDHVRANVRALDVQLDGADIAALEMNFPAPRRATPLSMI